MKNWCRRWRQGNIMIKPEGIVWLYGMGILALLSLSFQWEKRKFLIEMRLSPIIKIHIQGFELWHVYQFVPTLKVIAATIKSEISHFVIYSSTFCSLCQRMSNIIQILISQCPGCVILLCEPVMGEVRSLFWLEEMNLWYWTEGKSHWCFPQGGLWRLEGFFFALSFQWWGV